MSGIKLRHAPPRHDGPEMTSGEYAGSCRGKIGYTSRRHANGVRRVMLARSNDQHRPSTLNAYKCNRCHRWHLGNWFGGGRGTT